MIVLVNQVSSQAKLESILTKHCHLEFDIAEWIAADDAFQRRHQRPQLILFMPVVGGCKQDDLKSGSIRIWYMIIRISHYKLRCGQQSDTETHVVLLLPSSKTAWCAGHQVVCVGTLQVFPQLLSRSSAPVLPNVARKTTRSAHVTPVSTVDEVFCCGVG